MQICTRYNSPPGVLLLMCQLMASSQSVLVHRSKHGHSLGFSAAYTHSISYERQIIIIIYVYIRPTEGALHGFSWSLNVRLEIWQ